MSTVAFYFTFCINIVLHSTILDIIKKTLKNIMRLDLKAGDSITVTLPSSVVVIQAVYGTENHLACITTIPSIGKVSMIKKSGRLGKKYYLKLDALK